MKRKIALAAGLGLAFAAGHVHGTVQTVKHLTLSEFLQAKAKLGVEQEFVEVEFER